MERRTKGERNHLISGSRVQITEAMIEAGRADLVDPYLLRSPAGDEHP